MKRLENDGKMIDCRTLEERVAEHYAGLSGQLQKAADFVVSHPLDIASRSLRAISNESDVSPATFSRLSRALGYDSFEQMKDVSRRSVGQRVESFSAKAARLQAGDASGTTILRRQGEACIRNIETFLEKADEGRLEAAAATLRQARRVVLFGALGSTGLIEYMAYLARFFAPNWSLAGRMGSSLGSEMAELGPGDALLIVTKTPYVARAVSAAKIARDSGVDVVVVTDAHKSPALAYASHGFIVPSESPQFFSSYVATVMLIEALIAMVVARSEADTTAKIDKVEATNQMLGEYWAG